MTYTILTADSTEIDPPDDIAAVVTDPPYGVGLKHGRRAGRKVARKPPREGQNPLHMDPYWNRGGDVKRTTMISDDQEFRPDKLLGYGVPSVICGVDRWGYDSYPPYASRDWRWLGWCKIGGPPHQWSDSTGDMEFALIHGVRERGRLRPIKVYCHLWKGLCRTRTKMDRLDPDPSGGSRSLHPTQKPVSLCQWWIRQLHLPPGSLIYDPYAGSGSIGVAALSLGYHYLGVEIDPDFADTTRRRLAALSA